MSLAHLQRVSLNQTFPVCLFLCFLLFSVTNKRQSDLLTGSLVPREGSGTIDDSRQYSGLQEELCSSVQCLTSFHLSIVVLCDSRSEGKHWKWGKHGRTWAWSNYYISTTRGFYLFCDNKNSTFSPQIETQNSDKTRKVSACRGPAPAMFGWSLLSCVLSDRFSHMRPSCRKPRDLVLAEFALSVNSLCPIVLCLADISHSAHLWTTGYKFY